MILPRSVGLSNSHLQNFLLVALIAVSAMSTQSLSADDRLTMKDLIEKVRQNETLYENIDVVLNTSYDIGKRAPVGQEVSARQTRTQMVSQGTSFRIEITQTEVSSKGLSTRKTIIASDGKQMRLLFLRDRGNSGTIVPGGRKRADARAEAVRPHVLALRGVGYKVPLSTYLSGDEAIRAHPAEGLNYETSMSSEYLGVEELDGLKCHKVRHQTLYYSRHAGPQVDLWLAEERNFLPVKWEMINPVLTEKTVCCQGRVNQWSEVKSGLWFPMDMELFVYQDVPLIDEGQQKVQYHYRHKIDSVKFDPEYNAGYFSNVSFPAGTFMLEIKDGDLVRRRQISDE